MDRHDCESGEVAKVEVYIEVQFTRRGNSGRDGWDHPRIEIERFLVHPLKGFMLKEDEATTVRYF